MNRHSPDDGLVIGIAGNALFNEVFSGVRIEAEVLILAASNRLLGRGYADHRSIWNNLDNIGEKHPDIVLR